MNAKPWPLGPGEAPRLTLKAAIAALTKAGFRMTPRNAAKYHDLKRAFDARKLREADRQE